MFPGLGVHRLKADCVDVCSLVVYLGRYEAF